MIRLPFLIICYHLRYKLHYLGTAKRYRPRFGIGVEFVRKAWLIKELRCEVMKKLCTMILLDNNNMAGACQLTCSTFTGRGDSNLRVISDALIPLSIKGLSAPRIIAWIEPKQIILTSPE